MAIAAAPQPVGPPPGSLAPVHVPGTAPPPPPVHTLHSDDIAVPAFYLPRLESPSPAQTLPHALPAQPASVGEAASSLGSEEATWTPPVRRPASRLRRGVAVDDDQSDASLRKAVGDAGAVTGADEEVNGCDEVEVAREGAESSVDERRSCGRDGHDGGGSGPRRSDLLQSSNDEPLVLPGRLRHPTGDDTDADEVSAAFATAASEAMAACPAGASELMGTMLARGLIGCCTPELGEPPCQPVAHELHITQDPRAASPALAGVTATARHDAVIAASDDVVALLRRLLAALERLRDESRETPSPARLSPMATSMPLEYRPTTIASPVIITEAEACHGSTAVPSSPVPVTAAAAVTPTPVGHPSTPEPSQQSSPVDLPPCLRGSLGGVSERGDDGTVSPPASPPPPPAACLARQLAVGPPAAPSSSLSFPPLGDAAGAVAAAGASPPSPMLSSPSASTSRLSITPSCLPPRGTAAFGSGVIPTEEGDSDMPPVISGSAPAASAAVGTTKTFTTATAIATTTTPASATAAASTPLSAHSLSLSPSAGSRASPAGADISGSYLDPASSSPAPDCLSPEAALPPATPATFTPAKSTRLRRYGSAALAWTWRGLVLALCAAAVILGALAVARLSGDER